MVAAARSATKLLLGNSFEDLEKVNIPNKHSYEVPVSAASLFDNAQRALAITHCESGLSLDITRGLEIWTFVEFHGQSYEKKGADDFPVWLDFVGGEGLGKFKDTDQTCLSEFARQLIIHNLYPLLPSGSLIRLEVVFPSGVELAERTSNKSFGVIEGLALIGTQAEVQDSASPDQLRNSLKELQKLRKDDLFDGSLIYVIGENGLDLAKKVALPAHKILKTGNWLGPLIVAAAQEGVQSIVLFGYHGKLIKLAGGIFHTHHHLADGRIEILTSLAVSEDIPLSLIKLIMRASSMEEALKMLESQDHLMANKLWNKVAEEVEIRSKLYIKRYFSSSMEVGAVLFDRERQIRWTSAAGAKYLASMGMDIIS